MRFLTLLPLAILLSACAGEAAPTTTPPPRFTPVASSAAWTPIIETFDGVEMVFVPAGCFEMGHAEGRRDERPAHQVCIESPFWIDRTEVTSGQFGQEGHFAGENRPRENIPWFEARDYCIGRGGRLPTEAEWEYAASGPDNYLYPWGNDLVDSYLVFDRNAIEPAEVGSRPQGASWVGALDMAGNVFEWVSSIYAPYPYDAGDGREDPNDSTSYRVYRGGVGSYIDYGASTAKRFRARPDSRDWYVGFRCTRTAEG